MANALIISKQTGGYFAFNLSIDGAPQEEVRSIQNDLLTVGNTLHFKTSNGANIIKQQNITPAELTIIASGTFTFATVTQVWDKLIEVGFFDWLGTGGGAGVDRFDDLLDTFQYFGKDGYVCVVNESQQKLEAVPFYNYRKFTDLEDSPSFLVPNKMVVVNPTGDALILQDQPASPDTYLNSVGYFDYNDSITHTTPLAFVTNTPKKLTNDTLGVNTNTSENPYGVSFVWNSTNNQFDFSQLSIGDTVDIRIQVQVTTTTANQKFKISAKFGIGSVAQFENTVLSSQVKTAGLEEISFVAPFYIGSSYIRDFPAELYITSDAGGTVVVDGWYIRILRKNINILTIESSVPDATTLVKGIVRLGGDLSGTADNPTVPALATKIANTRLINTTAPLSGGGDLSVDRTISIPQANTSTNGYLAGGDWTTFNNKQNGSANLTSVSSLSYVSPAFVKMTGLNTFTLDTNTYLTATTGVTTFSAGTTGLTPSTATSGAVTLNGTLIVANGGTGSTTASGARTNLGVGTWGTLAYPTWVSGTPFVKMTASGTFALDTNTYLTSAVTTISGGTTGLTPNTATSGAITLAGTLVIANGGTGSTTASGARTNLGATTVGGNVFTSTNPTAITFLRANADNTVSWLDATTFRTAIGAGTSSTVGTVTSVSALTLGTNGTDLSSTVANGTTTPVITLNVPTASAINRGVLSSADWTTFNNKQNAIAYTPADDSLVVHKAGTETITGTKTFSASPLFDLGARYKTPTVGYQNINALDNGWSLGVGSITQSLIFNTTTNYNYTYPNASGTLALTSDLSAYQILLTNPVTGTGAGATNTIPKFTGVNALGNSGIIDNGTTVNFSTSNVKITGADATTRFSVGNSSSTAYIDFYGQTHATIPNDITLITNSAGRVRFFTTATERAAILANGNFLIGTTTDSGHKLQVSGTGIFNNSLTLNNPKDGTWTAGEVLSTLDFKGNDLSGDGVGTKAYVRALSRDTFGGAFHLTFGTDDSASGVLERMRIMDSGNILMGTTTDSGNKLRVNGTVRLDNLAGTGTRTVVADASGNLSAIPTKNSSIITAELSITNGTTSTVVTLDTNATYLGHVTHTTDPTNFKSIIVACGQLGGTIQGAINIINNMAGASFEVNCVGQSLQITNSTGATATFRVALNKIGIN